MPRQSLGPPLKAVNLYADSVANRPSRIHLSGLNSLQSFPQMPSILPMVNIAYTTFVPFLRTVPSGNVSSSTSYTPGEQESVRKRHLPSFKQKRKADVRISACSYREYLFLGCGATREPCKETNCSLTSLWSTGTEGYRRRDSESAAWRYSIFLTSSGRKTGPELSLSETPSECSLFLIIPRISATILSSTVGLRFSSQKNQASATEDVSLPARIKFTQMSLRNLSVKGSPSSSRSFMKTERRSDLGTLFSSESAASSFFLVAITP